MCGFKMLTGPACLKKVPVVLMPFSAAAYQTYQMLILSENLVSFNREQSADSSNYTDVRKCVDSCSTWLNARVFFENPE